MEHQQILNLLNELSDSQFAQDNVKCKFWCKKWIYL